MYEDALEVNIQGSRGSVAALEVAQLLYLLVEIRRPTGAELAGLLPLNLCLVIDRSTSMAGDRLDRVKAAAAVLLERLDPEDIISVVTFSDRADVVLASSPAGDRQALLTGINSIVAEGGTEMYRGLSAGLSELKSVALEEHTNHLILLTDGHTYGDDDNCLDLAQQAAAVGIGLSAFGIGSEWNDQFLDQLVVASGGQSAYVESPGHVMEILRKRIQGLGEIYAQNMRLRSSFPVGVNLRYGFKVTPFAQPLVAGNDEYQLGAIEGKVPLSVLLEMVVEPQLPGRSVQLPISLVADIPSRQLRDRVITHEFELEVAEKDVALSPPSAVVDAVKALNFYRMNEQIWKDVEDGHLKAATDRLRRLTTRLLEAGHTKLAQQAYAETERLMTMGTLSLEGRKQLKYGTRSLMTREIVLSN